MNRLINVILSFVPWSVYSWGMHSSLSFREKFILWCLLIIFMITVNRQLLLQGEAMTLANVFSFTFIFINYQFHWIPLFIRYPASFCYMLLAMIAAGSLVIKKPFTVSFTRNSLPLEKRRHILFYLINRNITLVWLLVFTVNSALNFYCGWSLLSRLVSLSFVMIALLASRYFPAMMRNHYRKRCQLEAATPRNQDDQ